LIARELIARELIALERSVPIHAMTTWTDADVLTSAYMAAGMTSRARRTVSEHIAG
jgi:hypothetical protein